MNKEELITRVSQDTDLDLVTVRTIIESTLDEISSCFQRKDNLEIRGFGSFKVVTTKQKMGRNISKGEPVVIPPKHKVKFKISSLIKL